MRNGSELSDDLDPRALGDELRRLAGPAGPAVDPVPGVRLRVRRMRRIRATGAALFASATVVAAAVFSGPGLDVVRDEGSDPGYAGTVVQPPPPAPTQPSAVPLPPPWSDTVPDVEYPHLYLPKPYLVGEGKVDGRDWMVVSFSQDGLSAGCLEVPDQEVFDPRVCFDTWPQGQRADWLTSYAYAAPKPSDERLKATLVIGAVSVEARTVEIKVGGRTFTTEAVGTPTSDRLRFFATVVPVKGATVTVVRPLDGAGKLTGRPDLPEEGGPCAGEQPKTGESGQKYTCRQLPEDAGDQAPDQQKKAQQDAQKKVAQRSESSRPGGQER